MSENFGLQSLENQQRFVANNSSTAAGSNGLPPTSIFEALFFKNPPVGVFEALSTKGYLGETNVWGIKPTKWEQAWKSGAPKGTENPIGSVGGYEISPPGGGSWTGFIDAGRGQTNDGGWSIG